MLLTVKEMEILCIFHAGSLSATIEALQSATEGAKAHPKLPEIKSLFRKLSRMADGDVASIGFEIAK